MIKRIVKMTFKPERIQDFLGIFEENKDNIRAFQGCHHVSLLRCTDPNNVFFTYSFWENEAALERYRKSDLFRGTWARTKVLFDAFPEAWSTKEIAQGNS